MQPVEVEQKQSIITCITPACRDPALDRVPLCLVHPTSACTAWATHYRAFWRNLPAVPEGFWSPGRSTALYSIFLWKLLSGVPKECEKATPFHSCPHLQNNLSEEQITTIFQGVFEPTTTHCQWQQQLQHLSWAIPTKGRRNASPRSSQ